MTKTITFATNTITNVADVFSNLTMTSMKFDKVGIKEKE